jgi:hypothetical protein
MTTAPANTVAELAHIAAQHVADWVDETSDGTTWGRYVRGT